MPLPQPQVRKGLSARSRFGVFPRDGRCRVPDLAAFRQWPDGSRKSVLAFGEHSLPVWFACTVLSGFYFPQACAPPAVYANVPRGRAGILCNIDHSEPMPATLFVLHGEAEEDGERGRAWL